MALPIVLVKNGSPKTNNHSQIVTPKSNNGNNNQYGTALEALLKQLRNNNNGGASTPVGGGPNQNKKNDLNSPLLGGMGKNQNGVGPNNQNGVGVNQVITQILKSQMSSNGGNTFSNVNGLSTPQGFDMISNNNNMGGNGVDGAQQYVSSPDNVQNNE